jgi:predicted flap endonuclease-1-like 5' DNA nuclease
MPSTMQPHYTNFLEAYNYMAKFWEPINQFIRNGVTNEETLKKFFSKDSYQNIVNQIMGFRTIGNTSELIETVNSWFEKVLEFTRGEWEDFDSINQRWKEQTKDIFQTDQFSGFKVASNFNNRLRDQLIPFYNVMAQGRETEIAKYLRDLQFAYISFILKSTELQSQVYEAGQFALPDTIKKYSQEFKEQQKVPNYDDFFKKYVNELENQILKVLHSDEYSKLQSEVSATGTNMQSMSQKMMELMFVDLPFLTKSDGDDFAKENSALRKKVRTLEQRLAELEKLVAQGVNLPAKSEDQKKKLLEVVGKATDHHDLKLIKGIGPKLEKMLNEIGISTFQQISKMTVREYELIDHLLEGFQGRAKRDHWAEQARDILLAAN